MGGALLSLGDGTRRASLDALGTCVFHSPPVVHSFLTTRWADLSPPSLPPSLSRARPLQVYLKSLHAAEWGNFVERLGVTTEAEAWEAERDAQGNPISGEMQVGAMMRPVGAASTTCAHTRVLPCRAAFCVVSRCGCGRHTAARHLPALCTASWSTCAPFGYWPRYR